MKIYFILILLSSWVFIEAAPAFEISIASELHSETLDGRILVLLSTDGSAEPRFQISDGPNTQLVFGQNVEEWVEDMMVQVSTAAYGYPLISLDDVPSGDYYVQVLLHKYETFQRSDGHTVKLPMDRGEGQQWNRAPGNLLSTVQQITIDQDNDQKFSIKLNREIPPITPPEDTKYVKHIQIKSDLLSEFWGRDMYLGAHVLLPEGFDEHPNVKYPLAIMHGHFPYDFGGWSTEPPDTTLPCSW